MKKLFLMRKKQKLLLQTNLQIIRETLIKSSARIAQDYFGRSIEDPRKTVVFQGI